MSWIKYLNNIFWNRTANSVKIPEESLGIFRWIYGFYVLLFATPTFSWLATVPDGFFDPPLISISYLFNGFPPGWMFQSIDIVIILSVLLITIGVKARMFTVILLVVKLFGLSFAYSMGKIDHSIMENALLLCMIIGNWGKHYAIIPDNDLTPNVAVKGLSLLAVFLSFGMFSAGIIKLLFWIDFDLTTSGFLTWYYGGYYSFDRTHLLAPLASNLPLIFYELADYVAVLFEITGFIMLLWSRKSWIFWVLIASLFHLTNTLILNIPFQEHVIVYLCFINFYALSRSSGFRLSFSKHFKWLGTIISILAVYHLAGNYMAPESDLYPSLNGLSLMQEMYPLYLGTALWTVTALLIFGEFKRQFQHPF